MTNIQRLNNIYKSGIDKTWSNTEIPDKLIEYLDYLKSKVTSYSKLKVLDIGCGRGRLIKRMIEDGWEDVTGIEVAGEAIKYLPPRIKLKIIVGDFMEERFNKKYDIITDLTMTCSVSPRHWSSIFRKINEILEGNYGKKNKSSVRVEQGTRYSFRTSPSESPTATFGLPEEEEWEEFTEQQEEDTQ